MTQCNWAHLTDGMVNLFTYKLMKYCKQWNNRCFNKQVAHPIKRRVSLSLMPIGKMPVPVFKLSLLLVR